MLLVYVRTSLRASIEKVNFLDDASAMRRLNGRILN